MKYRTLILAAVLLGIGLVGAHPARAGAPAQSEATPTAATQTTPASGAGGQGATPYAPPNPPGGQGNGAPPGPGANGAVPIGVGSTGFGTSNTAVAPANLVGQEPNDAVGYFLPVFLILGLLVAGIGALVATRRDADKARRIRGRDAPHVEH